MNVDQQFNQFLANIRPSNEQKEVCKSEHTLLRDRLNADPTLRGIVVTTFLQGSYRRATLVQPPPGDHLDVDVVVVTSLNPQVVAPAAALQTFRTFLRNHYSSRWKTQGRSLGIVGSRVDLDLVVTSAPSTVDQMRIRTDSDRLDVEDIRTPRVTDWERETPLWIPDREEGRWEQTHPLAQIDWTRDKNRRTNGHYVNVVKAIKWWKRTQPSFPGHPKSYPLEHMVGDCCPDGITSVAEGVVLTFEWMAHNYQGSTAMGWVPSLANRGLPGSNVLARMPAGDFRAFMAAVNGASQTARSALTAGSSGVATRLWQHLFGTQFPG